MIFCGNGESIHKCINWINLIVENEISEKVKQAEKRDFFQWNFSSHFLY